MSNYLRLKKMLYIVAFAAISIVLGLIEIPWNGFLKLDFSEVAILMSLLILGPKDTTIVILLRSLVRRMIKGVDPYELIGEALAIFASFAIMLSYYLICLILKKKDKPFIYEVPINGNKISIKEWIVTILTVTAVLTIILTGVNYFSATPLYFSGLQNFTVTQYIQTTGDTYWSFLIYCLVLYVPFNVVKGVSVSIVYLLIKPRIKYLQL